MKRTNILFFIIGTICFLIAGYIIYDKFTSDNELEVNFNEDEEIISLNDKLSEVGSSLGWLVIVDGISNQDNNGKYNLSFNKNLLEEYSNRQLFVMEYILSFNNYDMFTVLDMNDDKTQDIPTSDFTKAYVKYDTFNEYYKSLFGEDFDNNKAMKGNTSYDKEYVYYDNRRAGSNGVYVSMIQTDNVKYEDDRYVANVIITYSTRASELVGASSDIAIIRYTKDINDNIILKSFTLKDR